MMTIAISFDSAFVAHVIIYVSKRQPLDVFYIGISSL
jgi:hypothetical protein